MTRWRVGNVTQSGEGSLTNGTHSCRSVFAETALCPSQPFTAEAGSTQVDGKPTKGGSGSHAAYPNLRPPVRSAHLLIKFVPLETLERFRGAGRYSSAIDDSLTHFGAMLQEPASIAELLLVTVRG